MHSSRSSSSTRCNHLASTLTDGEPGDLVMCDNRCTMHRATEYDLRYVRAMHRTTVEGDQSV